MCSSGSYFPSQPGVQVDEEWPLGDESTWKKALKAQAVDPDDSQAVANTIVRHTTTTLARQAFNMDDVSPTLLLSCRTRTLTVRSPLTRLLLYQCETS